jgi:hypothetical protein
MAGGLGAHNFNSNNSLITPTPDKRGSGKDENSTSGKTLMESVFTVGGATTTATTKFHTGNNLEDDEVDSFASSVKSTQSHLETMSVNNFHDAQQEMPNSDDQPDQAQLAVHFNPITVEERQTNLIINAVKDLVMNPEEGAEVGALNVEYT